MTNKQIKAYQKHNDKMSKIELYDTLQSNIMRQARHSNIAGAIAYCYASVLLVTTLAALTKQNPTPDNVHFTRCAMAALLFVCGHYANKTAKQYKKEALKYRKKIAKIQRHR